MKKRVILARFRPQDEELLKKLCAKKDYPNVSVSMLPRFGFSGARLFVVNFTTRDSPCIFKVARINKAREEIDAVESMKDVGVEDCTRVRTEGVGLIVSDCGKWGSILYPHMGTWEIQEAENSVTLKQRLFFAEKPFRPLSIVALATTLKQVFERLRNAHRDPKWDLVPVKIAYDWYFREHKSDTRIRQILGKFAKESTFRFLGADLYNPLKLIASLPKFAKLPMGRVHGDLHPDNVVLHRSGTTPHLIDFAWAKKPRDILVDFALMENSIRFRDFPRTVSLEEQLRVDKALVQTGSFNELPKCESCDEKNRWAYQRLASAISVIRQSAKEVVGDGFSVERYLFCQFIVLYGLLRYEAYEPYTSVRALGIMAKRLHMAGWSFLKRTET